MNDEFTQIVDSTTHDIIGNKWKSEWHDMPEYEQNDKKPFKELTIEFSTKDAFDDFSKLIDQNLTEKTKSTWYPLDDKFSNCGDYTWIAEDHIMPKYPIYIISKGRSDSRLTSKALEEMGCDYYIVIEPQDYGDYSKVIDPKKILVLPFKNHGEGPGPGRNWCWEHSMALGAKRHWVMDDNIIAFYRLHKNIRIKCTSPAIFRASEDFVDRYTNVGISGLQYKFFCAPNSKYPPYAANTRIYSCLLIQNDIPFRWRGRYNEDTDICLRVLKAKNDDNIGKYATIQFNAFLQGKANTKQLKGGNTTEFYEPETLQVDEDEMSKILTDVEVARMADEQKKFVDVGGTLNKSKMLQDMHPDVAEVAWRFGRWHHYVNYEPFKKNKLIRIDGYNVDQKINTYGMKLIRNDTK